MVSASFQVENIDPLWSIVQIIIGFGTVACLCCVIFLGLKLKWFRAQFKVQDAPKNKKSSDTVQGIGFKVKSNFEDFQRYKSISEFATPTPTTANLTKIPENKTKVITVNEEKINTFAKVGNRNKELISENSKTNNHKESLSISTSISSTNNNESTDIKEVTIEESKETSFIGEYKKETEIKKSKVSFIKNNHNHNHNNKIEKEEIEENIVIQKQSRNPLSAQNIVMPQEDEDNWQIRIVDEKPKVQIDHRNDDTYYEEIHVTNNNNNNNTSNSMSMSMSNSMYSSQAASIFFGSYDSYDSNDENEKQVPDSPPPPIPRKFLEDQDTISMSSQTSA